MPQSSTFRVFTDQRLTSLSPVCLQCRPILRLQREAGHPDRPYQHLLLIGGVALCLRLIRLGLTTAAQHRHCSRPALREIPPLNPAR